MDRPIDLVPHISIRKASSDEEHPVNMHPLDMQVQDILWDAVQMWGDEMMPQEGQLRELVVRRFM